MLSAIGYSDCEVRISHPTTTYPIRLKPAYQKWVCATEQPIDVHESLVVDRHGNLYALNLITVFKLLSQDFIEQCWDPELLKNAYAKLM